MRKKTKGSSVIMWIISIYLIVPLALTGLYSLFTQWISIVPQGFTFQTYIELFQDSEFWASLGRTLLISFIPIVICTVVVLMAMYVTVVYLPKLDAVIKMLCTIPYAIQGVVLPISILTLYVNAPEPFSNRLFMLVSAYCVVILPYVYQGVHNALTTVRAGELLEAAQMLGAGRFYAFWNIIVPNITNGILVSSMLSFAVVFGDFVIINTLAGNYFSTGQMYLYAAMKESGQKASAVIVLFFLITLFISLRTFSLERDHTDRHRRKHSNI